MKESKIFKIIIVLIVGMILFMMTTNVFALEDDDTGLDFYEEDEEFDDQTNELPTNTNTNTNTNTDTNTNTNVINTNNTANSNQGNYNTSLPKAGAPENTMIGVAITVLAIIAVYAYKKINEYKNV